MSLPAFSRDLDGLVHGIWRIVPSPALSEVFARSGLDFQILDREHGAYDYATLLPDILACERHGCTPLVRVSGTDKVEVQRCLDLGAAGIVFPQLADFDDFVRVASWMDYAPDGTRGFNPFVRAADYGMHGAGSAARPRPWFIPIVESLTAAEQIERIARLERIDLVYIGSYDLSAALGVTGQMDAPALLKVTTRIIAACRAAGKTVSALTLSPAGAQRLADQGVRAIVHGVESHRVAEAITAMMAPMRDPS